VGRFYLCNRALTFDAASPTSVGGRGALWDHALPGGLLGGAEVVRRMASHEPQRIP
jgi:hypothetical protein